MHQHVMMSLWVEILQQNTVTVEDVPATFTITKTLDGESGIANGAVFSLYEIGATDPFATATSVKGLLTLQVLVTIQNVSS